MARKKTKDEVITGFTKVQGNVRYDNAKIIDKFQGVHGDRYDYSLVNYKGRHTKVKIICNIHGAFEQTAGSHLSGSGCPDCAGKPTYNNEKIIAKFREVHGDRYDYSLIEYVNSQKKIKIICRDHGVFEQKPNAHMSGKGCNICGGSHLRNKEEIITKFKQVHGDRYDYSLVDYVNSNKKVKIICREHGIFVQLPSNHLKGNNCPDCAGRPIYDNKKIISKFQEVHGDEYDYSQVSYVNSNTKVKITCKIHGVFEQTPSKHLFGQKCPKCVGNLRLDNLKIISKFQGLYGDEYDYSMVDYLNNHTKVKIKCKIHGFFEQTPSNHLNGRGCPECGERPRYNLEKIISKFKETHGAKYDYSLVDFINVMSKVKIICPEHGVFEQTPSGHLNGKGCPECGGSLRLDNKSIIAKFKEVHEDRYDYSLVNYTNAKTKIKIICQIHGLFEQTPSKHLFGQGCPACGGTIRDDNSTIISKFHDVHGDRYEYSLVNYINAQTKVKILCKIHGVFEQTPNKHLIGRGCPTCNLGWSKEKIIEFVNSIDNHDLLHMDAIELQMIIN